MQQSLAAANAAAGERVKDSMTRIHSHDGPQTVAGMEPDTLDNNANQQASRGLEDQLGNAEAVLPASSSQAEASTALPIASCESCLSCLNAWNMS